MEFIGTFFLVLSIVLAANLLATLAPIAIGATLIAMIYAGGHISKAHYNPAVTLAFYIRGRCEIKDVAPYIIAQILASILASVLGLYLLAHNGGEPTMNQLGNVGMTLPALISEFLGTFVIAFVILNVATAKTTEGNQFYGSAIGLAVIGCAYVLGGISGGAFNPAVAIGISIAEMSAWGNIWIFLLANFAGGASAAFAFRFINGDD